MCGDLRPSEISQTVSVCGWVAKRREHGDRLAFVDLRDHTGIIQCVIDNDVDIRSEYVVRITGVVRSRPQGTINSNIATGESVSISVTDGSLAVIEPFFINSGDIS